MASSGDPLDLDSWETPELLWHPPRSMGPNFGTAYEAANVKVSDSKMSIDLSFRELKKSVVSFDAQVRSQPPFGEYTIGGGHTFEIELIGKLRAYEVLRDPKKRATYDKQLGYAKADIASEIASDKGFGKWWAGLFAVWVIIILFANDIFARILGDFFAPDFESIWTHSTNFSALSYSSSDAVWQGLLNSWLAMSLAPTAAIGILAYLGYRWIDVPLSRVIAPVRCSGFSDIYVRSFCWVLVLSPHVALAVLKFWTE